MYAQRNVMHPLFWKEPFTVLSGKNDHTFLSTKTDPSNSKVLLR